MVTALMKGLPIPLQCFKCDDNFDHEGEIQRHVFKCDQKPKTSSLQLWQVIIVSNFLIGPKLYANRFSAKLYKCGRVT